MVHPPVRGPDHCNTFSCLHLAVCFAPLRDYCPDSIINIHLALLGLAPPSSPQVVRPTLLARTSFEQGLTNKLHNSLVIKNKSQTKQSIKQQRDAQPSSTPAALVAASNKKAAPPPAPPQSCTPSLPTPISCLSTSVSGSKEKKRILEENMSKFGSAYQESIITKKKGKLNHNEPLQSLASSWQGMKPSTNKYYQVKELTIYNVVTIVIQEYAAFSKNELLNIHLLNTDFAKNDTQAPIMAPDRLFYIMRATFEL
jgi:hypothetical protein